MTLTHALWAMDQLKTFPEPKLCCIVSPVPYSNTAQPDATHCICVYCKGPICQVCLDSVMYTPGAGGMYHHPECVSLCDHRTIHDEYRP